MSRGSHKAQEFLNSIGWERPGDLSLRDMVWTVGAFIEEELLDGSEGRIIMNGETAIIKVNSRILYQPKKNFIIAHELGHFLLHRSLTPLFSETERTLAEWHKNGLHEKEANEFAAELLMPSRQFVDKVKGEKLSFPLIQDVADYFETSVTATFLRYKDLGDYPLMIIYSEKGIVKWKFPTRDFPFQYLPIGSKIPPYSVTGDLLYHHQKEDTPELVDAIEWFPEDFEIKYKRDWQLYEQCFEISSDSILTCLWAY